MLDELKVFLEFAGIRVRRQVYCHSPKPRFAFIPIPLLAKIVSAIFGTHCNDVQILEIGLKAMDAEMTRPTGDFGLDTRQISLKAPAGTPLPLREAYEAIAETLFNASDMRDAPPTVQPVFQEQARRLSDAWKAGRKKYEAVELLLQSEADEGHCSHQEALNAICRVNDACGHVVLGTISFDQVTEYLQAVPAVNLAELLRAMRRQVSRAALRSQETERTVATSEKSQSIVSAEASAKLSEPNSNLGEINSRTQPTVDPVIESDQNSTVPLSQPASACPTKDTEKWEEPLTKDELVAGKLRRQPSDDAFTAYRVSLATGKNQIELAELLTKEWKRTVHQGNVSRWLGQVKHWLEAGNVLPELSAPLDRKPLAMDPERIDLGQRRDRHSARQRDRCDKDAGD